MLASHLLRCAALLLLVCAASARPTRRPFFVYDPNNTDLIEGDIIPPKHKKQRFTTYTVVNDRTLTWPDGVVFYKYEADTENESEIAFDNEAKAVIEDAMQLIQKKTCIRFQTHSDEENFVSIAYRRGRCASNVGMQGGEQTVALDPSLCLELGQVAHEFLHALGFFHEHSRPDRDEYVRVLWDNIIKASSESFWRNNETEADTLGEPYDYESVMHYPHDAFSKPGSGSTLLPKAAEVKPEVLGKAYQENFLTDTDIRKLNVLYTCGKEFSEP
ncbi:high choriolytic enzyme 1-like isoform X1 [Dermacentor andersoni]|uniref:high choriolytic enzyme 1-like isoform X1 n=1 Tax=Dermacentor andersoni TaxID=34620 RepID=UPI002155CC4B|nr:high choriolytic enzyme 1-like isoform X1 [Dermacentor andersoni]